MQRGWVYRPEITDYEKLLFDNAMSRHRDSFHYTPVAIAEHEEADNRYRFLCIASPKTNLYNCYIADIEIYKPVSGMPYATCIYRQDIDKLFPQRF
jgi:hypothetical protein